MRSHIEMQTQENIEAGMNPEEARYAALRQFGWVESIKETCREQRGVRWIENLGQDVRYGAWRTTRRGVELRPLAPKFRGRSQCCRPGDHVERTELHGGGCDAAAFQDLPTCRGFWSGNR